MKVSFHCCVIIVLNVKNVTLESVYDSIFSLAYIFDLAPVALETIYEIVTLTNAIYNCIVGFVIVQIFDLP